MYSSCCFTVHYRLLTTGDLNSQPKNNSSRAMRPLLSVTEVGENRNVSWLVHIRSTLLLEI